MMFQRLKSKLRSKVIKLLGVDNINLEISELKTNLDKCYTHTDYMYSLNKGRISSYEDKINSLHRTLQEVVKVGVEVDYPTSHSWAVVCYNKTPNNPTVKFIPLYGYNGIEITEFLKRFDAGSFKIDTPFSFIEEGLLYDWK